MTRFDELRGAGASPARIALDLIVARPMVALAMTLLSAAAVAVATGVVGTQALVPALLDHAFVASPVVVFAAPAGTREESDALGARLKALPLVAGVVSRTKEDALASLIQAGMPPASDGRNPLPDTWILTLRPDASMHGAYVTTANALRDTLAAQPGVDQVRFDARWNERLEGWLQTWTRYVGPAVALILVLVAVCLLIAWVVAREAILAGSVVTGSSAQRALTWYAAFVILGALAVTVLASWAAWVAVGRFVEPWLVEPVGTRALVDVAAIATIAVVLGMIGPRLHRRDSL